MSKLTKARVGDLLRKLFEVLLGHPQGLPAKQALDLLAARVEFTPYELELTREGRPRYVKRLYYSSVNLARAGWLAKRGRAAWVVTERGKQAYANFVDPLQFYQEAEHGRYSAKYGGASQVATKKARDEIKSYLQSRDPYDFQDLVADLLQAMGYHIAWKAKRGKDGGTDIIAWSDPLGVRPPRIRVQVKCQGPKVDVTDLRQFLAVLGDGEAGLYVATTSFTKDAEDAARTDLRRSVSLVNVDRLIDLWVEYYPKLDDAARRRFPLQPIYFLAPGN
ncbi:MAG: Mrr restriction system protein [Gemmataceae bacterium]|nr:Mrr restriction system protein [Gemmataceae bacterium]